MTDEDLEQRLRSVTHPPLPEAMKKRVLAHAGSARRATFRPQRWLAVGLAAAWVVIAALSFITPGAESTGFTRAAVARTGPPPGPVPTVNASALLVARVEIFTPSLR